MELKCKDGDYVWDDSNGVEVLEGERALLQRVLFRLTARRGEFPFLETLGSQLWKLGRVPRNARQAMAEQAVVEALAPETGLRVTAVELEESGSEEIQMTVRMEWQGTALSAVVQVQ